MKTIIISYSSTGNNDALASSIAKNINAEHIKIADPTAKLTFSLLMKHVLGLTPNVKPSSEVIGTYEFVILCGPVWMGRVAAPIRPYLDYIKNKNCKYGFITLSGGAPEGKIPNPNIGRELSKRVGRDANLIIKYHISDLLPKDPKPEMKDTMEYRITKEHLMKFTKEATKLINEAIKK